MKARQACLGLGLLLLAALPVHASNGMNMIGFGGRSTAMAGADLAVTDTPAAMNINPAGIGWCVEPEFDFGLSLMNPSLTHTDRLGNNRADSLDRIPMPFMGYVRPRGKMTWGVGLFVQGGLGAEYENLTTPMWVRSQMLPAGTFGNSVIPPTDGVKTKLAHAKLTPAVAWRVSPTVTVGASLNVSYARAEMKFFPETSLLADLDSSGMPGDAPGEAFSGMHLDDVSALDFGLRVGFQYRRDALMIGGSYSTETGLDFDDGTMTLNLSASPMGLGKVDYDAEIADFAWPQRAGLGIGYRFNEKLLVAADADWVNWSGAIETLTIKLSNPDPPAAPQTQEIRFRMDWESQWIWALGFELTPRPKWAVRWGYNHGDAPIPESTLRPQFPAIAEDHLTAGLGYSTGPWTFNLGLEYVFESEKTNNHPDPALNPFGPGSTETLSQFMAHFTVRRTLVKR